MNLILTLKCQAALYQTDFCLVPLQEYVKVGNAIYNKLMKIAHLIPKTADHGGKDPNHVAELCNEVCEDELFYHLFPVL